MSVSGTNLCARRFAFRMADDGNMQAQPAIAEATDAQLRYRGRRPSSPHSSPVKKSDGGERGNASVGFAGKRTR